MAKRLLECLVFLSLPVIFPVAVFTSVFWVPIVLVAVYVLRGDR